MESQRIKLTPPSLAYADSMWTIIQESEAELSEFLPWVSESLTLNKLKDNIEFAAEHYNNFSDDFWFNIIEKRTGAFIGAVGFIVRDPDVPYFEIGYWLCTSMVGKGYISEAVKIIERFAFVDNKAQRVEIKMAGSNVKSRAVAERCGYQFEAKLENGRRLVSGELDSTVIYVKTALE
ncbi:ribosomal protein acetyltransferase [Photobacterium swingsii]|uniref:N-acetyltransferase n=1 Tax=Photobacterium swingsii TaxID=680026 RepID=A0A0J8XZW5_9GAMM|nr:GNAT family N-acetyltransferase [Photobacterium swingsii]KMV30934.1 ribosomal protein acetyltransferase [Photobacterium swingsii]PSW23406.1 N-acetyltransferase [Photobacterium swingsii]